MWVNSLINQSKIRLQDQTSDTIGQVAESTPSSFPYLELQTPATSIYSPNEANEDVKQECKPLEMRNTFLETRDISPVRFPLTTQWEEAASERTRRRHLRKANQAVDAVLEEVAPNQSGQLWKSLVASKFFDENPSGNEREPVDEVLMEVLAECYRNASNWQTRRQILSIMADKDCFKTLKKWIPNLTRYQFSEARKHILVEGRGVALSLQSTQTRMAVSQTQLDHFLDFITSTHVIRDLPFGQKSINLSTKEVITVPNVIRVMVPESIVKQ